ncbi:MAG: carboxy-S-adenosyl-L-methionine synthase CmoA [Pseudomonadales bacterium]|nr:carboxy-S-adenosyl-L-methionine synthase CmoA [Gammaproteobacteria bacterium]MBK7169398.1 carboxy-S-adenosyl-L-methionine synthase CmoA [Gammaproteobacteria bacterium]MBP6051883.1 carboxy-S-adenosyl-L-methionine synthase CmoA [Pseudomonadales bacterium]
MTESSAQPERDAVYAAPRDQVGAFHFDAEVAGVFADMIARSVPGYALTLQMIAVATREYARPGRICYDLGCSLGASTLSIRHHAPAGSRVVGIDNSPAMVERCRAIVVVDPCPIPVDIRCADLLQCEFGEAALITMNFTLQFIPPQAREPLLGRLAEALDPGGCLVLSEKIAFDDPREQELLQTLHHGFKHMRGYSELEIAQKRAALENVLLPETLDTHRRRLAAAGFSRVTVWLQCLNFVSLLALK